jgi:translation initiation factor IF-3
LREPAAGANSSVNANSRYLTVLQSFLSCYTLWPSLILSRMVCEGGIGRKKSPQGRFFLTGRAIFGGGFIAERSFRQADRIRINDRIRAREIRVVDEDGGQLGVMPPFEAIKLAKERGLDLVEISPTADPPVCKITDYGKYLYQTNKKAHEQRKHQKGSQLKEVKFRPATAEHDFQVRKNQIIRFLGEGHKVKAMIFHRGREMAHQEVGRAKMHRLLGEIADHALVEIGPRMEANVLMALLAPKRGGGAPPPKPAGAPAGGQG